MKTLHYLAFRLLVALIVTLSFFSNAYGNTPSEEPQKLQTNTLLVAIPPFLYLSEKITENIPELVSKSLLQEDGNPHLYLPTSKDIKMLQEAKIFFASGLEFENQLLHKIQGQLTNLQIHALHSSVEINTSRDNNQEKHDDHDKHGHEDDHDEHGHEDDHDEHGHSFLKKNYKSYAVEIVNANKQKNNFIHTTGLGFDKIKINEKHSFMNRFKSLFGFKSKKDSHDHDEHDHSNELHFWVDPVLYLESAKIIHAVLLKNFPQHSETLNANYENLALQITNTHKALATWQKNYEDAKPKTKPKAYTLHNFLNAFKERYNIEEISLEDEKGGIHGKRNLRWQRSIGKALKKKQKALIIFTPETLYKNNPLQESFTFSTAQQSLLLSNMQGNIHLKNFTSPITVNTINITPKVTNKKSIFKNKNGKNPPKISGILINPLKYNVLNELLILGYELWPSTSNSNLSQAQ